MRQILDLRPALNIVPTSFIVDLLEIVLTTNYFMFNSTYYQQCSGTSMGAIFAHYLANLYVGQMEQEFIIYTSYPFRSNIKCLKCYKDNIFMVWKGTQDTLYQFTHYLNTCQPYLKFTHDTDRESISFLDLRIKNQDKHLIIALY